MRLRNFPRGSVIAVLGMALACLGSAIGAQGQTPAVSVAQEHETPTTQAAAATELPVGAWGPYARAHSGPCYLANRLLSQLFVFPIVVGQRREALILRPFKTADGKTRLRPERALLERRAMGLSPVQAANDDRAEGEAATRNRRARILEADADGLFWSAQIDFAPAKLAQEVATAPGAQAEPPVWGAGEATVTWFPAYADPAADGLLVRVTLTNRSSAPQTYFVDLLGGMSTLTPQFDLPDLSVQTGAGEDGVIIQHAKCEAVFALAAGASQFPARTYRVGEGYFGPDAAISQRDAAGVAQPAGLLASPSPGEGQWGLARADDITVAPGASTYVFLCVGVGADKDAARESALTLLSLADDAMPMGKPREGAYTRALAAHAKARYASGDAALDRLMAQSLANIPFGMYRRIGVPTRMEASGRAPGSYQPEAGGYIALGWAGYRPVWAAAQLNAWFLTNGNADAPIERPQATAPTNLFALWELYQRTHDREMLTRFYPFARRRYRERLAAGRTKPDSWLFAWPEARPGDSPPQTCAPEYSAYVIRAAQLLRFMAEETGQSVTEPQEYTRDITEATRALNSSLWEAGRGLYLPKPVADASAAPTDSVTLSSLLPLLAGPGAIPPERRAALLKTLTDPAAFWSDYGLRSVSKAAPGYRADAPYQGAIHIGPNWLLWKALLDYGETETARKLAENVARAYHAAQTAANACPEWLNGDTGAAGGATDYSGDASAALPLYAAYHRRGTVSSGWDTVLLDQRYDAPTDTLHLVFRSLNPAGKSVLLCVLGQPNGRYTLSGALTGSATADANGVLTLTPPDAPGTRQMDIAPAAEAAK
ncbi:MAG TPA: trehalase family glycosidase [Chthonomonadaceae bacterium]|nr:trehalase family glycosidase [Chthonomonadaceae bacterium]